MYSFRSTHKIRINILSPILGITKEIMSLGPQVLAMECQGPGEISLIQLIRISTTDIVLCLIDLIH
jgi:hypothetical protein